MAAPPSVAVEEQGPAQRVPWPRRRLHGTDGPCQGHQEARLGVHAAAVPEVAELRRMLDRPEVRQELVRQGLSASTPRKRRISHARSIDLLIQTSVSIIFIQ